MDRKYDLQRSDNPVFEAIIHGLPVDDIEALLRSDSDYIHYTFSSQSLMDISISEGRLEVVKVLIDNGFPLDGIFGSSHPLSSAMHYDQIEIAEFLINEGSDPYSGNPSPIDLAKFSENEQYMSLFGEERGR